MPRLTPLTAGGLAAVLAAGVLAATSPADADAAAPTQRDTGAARTRLTFQVADCEGCEIRLTNARRTLDADVVHVWTSRPVGPLTTR